MALGLIVAVPVTAVSSVGAAASIKNCLTQGTNLDGTIGANGECTGDQSNSTSSADLNTTIASVVNIISIVVGVIAVIMIIWGGLRYITSGGESGKITGAKNTIIYALIGLVVVALAQFIVHFVLAKTADIAN